jgi:trimethylguanosine synthase
VQSKDLDKFYKKRYSLFSRFDAGVNLDQDAWMSTPPESVMMHIAAKVVS